MNRINIPILFRSIGKYRFGILGTFLTMIMIVSALLAPFLSPLDPYDQDISKRFTPPSWHEQGNMKYLLGTDHVGRDTLSRLIYGSRISLSVGLFAVLISANIGIIFGLLAGYYSGFIDSIISYLIDLMLSVPYILLAMALVATFGASYVNVFIVLGITGWPIYARVLRSEVLRIREMEYIRAARALGMKKRRIITLEILPNLLNNILVIGTIQTAQVIIAESFLSFLGLGVQPPIPSWGGMLAEGRDNMLEMWWLAAFPGIAIFLTALGMNLLGDGLRDFFDPFKRKQA